MRVLGLVLALLLASAAATGRRAGTNSDGSFDVTTTDTSNRAGNDEMLQDWDTSVTELGGARDDESDPGGARESSVVDLGETKGNHPSALGGALSQQNPFSTCGGAFATPSSWMVETTGTNLCVAGQDGTSGHSCVDMNSAKHQVVSSDAVWEDGTFSNLIKPCSSSPPNDYSVPTGVGKPWCLIRMERVANSTVSWIVGNGQKKSAHISYVKGTVCKQKIAACKLTSKGPKKGSVCQCTSGFKCESKKILDLCEIDTGTKKVACNSLAYPGFQMFPMMAT